MTIPVHVSGRTRRPASVVAAGLVCGWWVTSLTPFSTGATVAVLAFGTAEIAVADAVRRRRRRPRAGAGVGGPDLPGRAYLVWVVAIVLLAAWELFSLFSHPRSAHPTISSMVDPFLAHHPVRWLAFAAWAWLGWGAGEVTSRAWDYVGWALVAAAFAVVQVGAVATRRWATVADVVRAVTRRRTPQLACLAGWLWLGWHFFVRSSR